MWIDDLAAIKIAALMELLKLKEKEKNMEQTNETILGSHNSMSYLPPLHWWGWLMRPFARCQNKTIDGQLAAGVRCFDLRIAFDWQGMAHFRHGWCRFGGDRAVGNVLKQLQHYGKPVYVRLILEEPLTLRNVIKRALGLKVAQKPNAANEYYFPRRCALYKKIYKDITFLGGNRKFDWAQLYDFGTGDIPLHQWVSSMDGNAPWWQKLLPRLYAAKHNAANMQNLQPGINLFDFV